jgi:hypothetical protein
LRRVNGFDAQSIELLAPTLPAFDDFARPLLGERIADSPQTEANAGDRLE